MLLPAPSEPRHSATAADKAKSLLERALGPSKVLTEPASCERYARDDSEAEARIPDAVVKATCAEDILATLEVARTTEVPVTPRAGGTGRTGGATTVAGGIVLELLGMDQIKEIDADEQLAVVEPGVILGDLHAAVEAEGLFYPPDPNSLVGCSLGGNVAENAGGPRAFKYGVTGNYVLGVEAFLIGGQRIHAGRRTRKGVTGYDVTSLLVGSEGTLAVFGDITLRLRRKPEAVMTLLVTFADMAAAARTTTAMVAAGAEPRCVEFLDGATLEVLRGAGNPIDPNAGALLIVEVDGDEAACETEAERIAAVCDDAGALDVLVAQDPAQRDRLWAARREMSGAVRRLAKNKLSEDIVVPRRHIAEVLERNARTCAAKGVRSVAYGHAGDGNLHVNFLWDEPEEMPRVGACIEQLFRDTVELGGTLSGEHGIGVLKAPYLELEQSAPLIALQRDLKRSFDPLGLLNPGKIFSGRGHGAC